MPEWVRELCQVIGALTLLSVGCTCTWIAAVECCQRSAERRHRCSEYETVDAKTCYLTFRCTVCGRTRELGIAWHVGTNRRTRRSA
jgi:hypothetical protein